jgi:hypothetical protein
MDLVKLGRAVRDLDWNLSAFLKESEMLSTSEYENRMEVNMAEPETRKAPHGRQGFEKIRGVILKKMYIYISQNNKCQANSLATDTGICQALMGQSLQLMTGSISCSTGGLP